MTNLSEGGGEAFDVTVDNDQTISAYDPIQVAMARLDGARRKVEKLKAHLISAQTELADAEAALVILED